MDHRTGGAFFVSVYVLHPCTIDRVPSNTYPILRGERSYWGRDEPPASCFETAAGGSLRLTWDVTAPVAGRASLPAPPWRLALLPAASQWWSQHSPGKLAP